MVKDRMKVDDSEGEKHNKVEGQGEGEGEAKRRKEEK
jgi:hypothetical protein